ncbi:MAG: small basic protein [Phycisphaeraceae bacterium]
MSIDRSLKVGGNLARHRNVLSRPERIARLAEKGRFDAEKGSPLNLPKVANRKVAAAAKAAKKKDAAAAEGAVAAVPAAAPAAAAKPAAKPAGKGKDKGKK